MNARAGAAVIVASGVAFSALQLSSWSDQPVIRVVNDVVVLVIALVAGGCSLAAAGQVQGRRRAAWIWMAVGIFGFAAGQLVWTYNGLTHAEPPFQSLADVGYGVLPVGAGLALLSMLRDYPRPAMLRVLLDAVVVAGALFGATWVALLGTVYAARAMDAASVVLTLMYPIADIAVVTIALLMLVRAPAGEHATLAMVTGGLVLITAADVAYAYVTAVEGQYYEAVSLGYAWGFLAIGAGALWSRRSSGSLAAVPPGVPSPASMWLPVVPIAIAVVSCAPVMVPTLGPLYLVGIVTVFAVMVRQLLVLRENRRLLAEASEQALRDPLTGLANRTLFADRLVHAMALQKRHAQAVAVLLIDLDDFKLVNDNLGHQAGDTMLVGVSERLAATVRASDTVARLGGDEFAILMEGVAGTSRAVAQRVVEAFDLPFVVDGQELLVRPSVGLAIATHDDVELTAEKLLKQADVAMYRAKRSHSSQLSTFTSDMDVPPGKEVGPPPPQTPARGRPAGRGSVRLLRELRHAIDHDGLRVLYQPKFDLRTDAVVGVEALVRWQHPRRGLLSPDQFLPLVRQNGLMRSVTAAVLDIALDDAAQWSAQGLKVPVAINVFAPSVADTAFPRQLVSALERRGLPPDMLTVEITEDLLLEHLAKTRAVLAMLRRYQIRIAIDDFGNGYSALWYLREFPVDEVKLDRHFIAPILTHAPSAAIVRAVIDLAHALNITPVAEGVENAETARRLLEYGCEVAQGFYCSPPLPAAAVVELLESRKRKAAPVADDHESDGTRRSEIELMQ